MKKTISQHLLLFTAVLLATCALALVGCGKKDEGGGGGGESKATTGQSSGQSAAARVKAKQIFQQRCVICHGATGKGDGTGAATLAVKPRDYTDPAWQKTVSDEDLKKTIVGGGQAVGKSPLMTPNPDLGKPENEAVLEALVQIIRDFGKQ